MHARDLMELSAIVSAHGPILVRGETTIPAASIEHYWAASKCRLDRWLRALKQFSTAAVPCGAAQRQARWRSISGVLEEILTGEVLTRVWTAVICIYDRRRGQCEFEPVARGVLIGHHEARHRVLTLMVRGTAIDADEALKLNGLRRRCERWTDLLVGNLATLHNVDEFAFEPERAREFSDDLVRQAQRPGGRHAWPILLGSLRAAFRQGLGGESPNADLNGRVGAAILACFQPELFDSTGLLRSLWLHRLEAVANDAQGLIDDLLGPPPASGAGSSPLRPRQRRFEA